jgi:hypothetical protein
MRHFGHFPYQNTCPYSFIHPQIPDSPPDPRFTPDVNDGMLAVSTVEVGGHWATVAVNDEGQDAGYGIRLYLHF